MSRAFSTSTRAARSLKWIPVNTTKPVGWIRRGFEEYIDIVDANYPELANKVSRATVGVLHGNPHPTPHKSGLNEPFHGSGAIGEKNLKRDDRMTSLHIYPNGLVKPTNDEWPTLYVTAAKPEDLGEEDTVWLDQKHCEQYESGQLKPGNTSEDKQKGKGKNNDSGKGKAKESSSSSSVDAGGNVWEWDNEVQMNKRWDKYLGTYVCWDEDAQAERYWDGKEWKWVR